MPTVTALRPARPGRVHVELDGGRWRTVPLDVAARVGLSVGAELDRQHLRALRLELRRAKALDAGARSLARRERSERELDQILERKGIPAAERSEALASLRRVGGLDDERFARSRAAALAKRGLGDAAIAFALERAGVAGAVAEQAVAELEPEAARAARLASRRRPSAQAARWLAGRGFSAESIEAALPGIAETGTAELG
ncbi:MAG TPA: regulatory protein RecX [Gaiellaceae bacterium]